VSAIIGKKLGMTQIFDEAGAVVPVTVVEAGPCPVLRVEERAAGSHSVQLGFGLQKPKRASRAEAGHAAAAGVEGTPQVLREFPFDSEAAPEVGGVVEVGAFEVGARVKVTGTTKGRGFQGVVKRYGFRGGPASHGASRVHRAPGSIGAGTNPSRVIKGKRLPGRMGGTRKTLRNVQVAKVDGERNLLYLRGAVPGAVNGVVFITEQ
jgi:large subunit ribosomal protein L3